MDCRYVKYSESVNLLKDYKPFTVVTCNPYSVMPCSIYDYITEYCYIQDKEDRSCEGKVFKHVFTEINDDEFFTFYIYRVPADFKIPKPKTKEKFHMETKQELREIIDELKEKLKEAQDKLENLNKNERWKPNTDDAYWFVTDSCENDWGHFSLDIDTDRYNTYNCFYTQKEAQKEANKILIRRKLEDIARRLNGNEKIDWSNENQRKYFINYYFNDNNKGLCMDWNKYMCVQGAIYCLDKNFIDQARKEIGEKELISYLTDD